MIGVVAHTARAEAAHTLMDTVQAAYLSMDDGTLGCNDNHKKVWAWLHNHREHHQWLTVLEDDAVPQPDFVYQLNNALAATDADVVSTYLGRHHIPTLDWEVRKQQAIDAADNAGAHWIHSNHLLHAVAVSIRTTHTEAMWRHITKLPPMMPIDEALTHWILNNGLTVAYTWPSLCDHADTPTLFRHHDKLPRPPGRIAYRTGTHTTWNSKAVTM